MTETDKSQPYYSYSRYLTEHYGGPLHRVPIDLGFGCPNRDFDGTGGCTFCPADGARARQTIHADSIEDQVREAIEFARRRYGAKRFIAYIQAFTGTFAQASEQRRTYEQILGLFPFEAVSIGTRPDCLPTSTLDFLEELNQRLEVWVELGVQTSHDRTLERINRGHDWGSSEQAILALHQRGIKVIAHVILGLPGETASDFNATAERLAKLPIDGIKVHNLHVISGTQLAQEYQQQPFPLLHEFDYCDHLIEFLRRIPAHIPMVRVQTDTPDVELVGPQWSMDKGQFLDTLIQHMRWRRYQQGDLVGDAKETVIENEAVKTEDGSITFWSSYFKEHYHTTVGARSEAENKYLSPSAIEERLANTDVRLLDVCFGLGYNTIAACKLAEKLESGHLHVVALEIDRGAVGDAAALTEDPFAKQILTALYQDAKYHGEKFSIKIIWGDARHTIEKLTTGPSFDFIYHDAFSTQKSSELWTVDFFRKEHSVLSKRGKLLTYCASLPARAGMIEAGFHVGNTPAFGRTRCGTIATIDKTDIELPLETQEVETIRSTTKGIPFRDPHGTTSNREILRNREQAVTAFKAGQL
ncbi:TIGR01212 family radical SAM protein [bacterium M21]|nr:TIGR01212 family radical SAM protein [bacterium M21]